MYQAVKSNQGTQSGDGSMIDTSLSIGGRFYDCKFFEKGQLDMFHIDGQDGCDGT